MNVKDMDHLKIAIMRIYILEFRTFPETSTILLKVIVKFQVKLLTHNRNFYFLKSLWFAYV